MIIKIKKKKANKNKKKIMKKGNKTQTIIMPSNNQTIFIKLLVSLFGNEGKI
jgi:hypothetical protein